jgi:hypothetical protein
VPNGAIGTLHAMSRALVNLNLWLLGSILVVGLPLVTGIRIGKPRIAQQVLASDDAE